MHITVPRFEKIPYVWHGFGTRELSQENLRVQAGKKDLDLVLLDQIHSDCIHVLAEPPETQLRGDAMLTTSSGLLLTIKTADCLPVLVLDERQKLIAAVHCGWRGTSKRLLAKVVRKMSDVFDSEAADLLVVLGPSIGPDCYEVGEDVRECFGEAGLEKGLFRSHPQTPGKYFFDLKLANRNQLLECGVQVENVFSVTGCTHCEKNLYSYRREHLEAGRLLNFIGLL